MSDRVGREGIWKIFTIYGVEGRLLKAVQPFYKMSKPYMRVNSKLSDEFSFDINVRQGFDMSSLLLNVYIILMVQWKR